MVPPQVAPQPNWEFSADPDTSTQAGSDDSLHCPPQAPPAEAQGENQVITGESGSTRAVADDGAGARAPNAPRVAYTSSLVIPAADFGSDGNGTNSYRFPFASGGYVNRAAGTICIMAPAHLPLGATMTEMYISIYDNGGTTRPLANVQTPSTLAGIQNLSTGIAGSPMVAYPQYSYCVGIRLYNTAQRLYSARIYYSAP